MKCWVIKAEGPCGKVFVSIDPSGTDFPIDFGWSYRGDAVLFASKHHAQAVVKALRSGGHPCKLVRVSS